MHFSSLKKFWLFLVVSIVLVSCNTAKDNVEEYEPNIRKRTEAAAKKDGGIIVFGGEKKGAVQ